MHAQLLSHVWLFCDPMDGTLPGSSLHGILWARILGVGCHFLLQGTLPNPGKKPISLESPAWVGRFFTTKLPGKLFQEHGMQIYNLYTYQPLIHT